MTTLALFQQLGMWELLILGGLGLLIFGRRLPEVGRGLGRSIVEFRKGLKGIEDDVEEASSKPSLPKRDEPPRSEHSVREPVAGTVPQQPASNAGHV